MNIRPIKNKCKYCSKTESSHLKPKSVNHSRSIGFGRSFSYAKKSGSQSGHFSWCWSEAKSKEFKD